MHAILRRDTLQCLLPLASLLAVANAATVVHDFSIGWVYANPDGAFNRPTIGVNGQWPLPVITANIGDNIIVNVKNDLGNQTTSLHFHGLFMNGTNYMDGPTHVTQCPIPVGGSFTYNFTVCENHRVTLYETDLLTVTLHSRSSSLELTGITLTVRVSTLTASGRPSWSMTPTTRIGTTRRSSCPYRIGIMTKCKI